jgi:hypothetical protein
MVVVEWQELLRCRAHSKNAPSALGRWGNVSVNKLEEACRYVGLKLIYIISSFCPHDWKRNREEAGPHDTNKSGIRPHVSEDVNARLKWRRLPGFKKQNPH